MSGWLKPGVLFPLWVIFITGAGHCQTKSNLQLLNELVVKPVVNALDSLPEAPPEVVISLKEKSEFADWAVKKLQEAILKKRIRVFDTLTASDTDWVIIDLEKMKINLSYRVKKRKWLVRPSRYMREIEGILSFSIRRHNGAVLYSGEREIHFQDVISATDLKTVENEMYPFSQGTKRESKFVKRFLEPVVITGATASVIYLFYTLRSGS